MTAQDMVAALDQAAVLIGEVRDALATTPPPTTSKYSVTNATPVRTYNATNTKMDELANVIAAIIQDLGL